ncbi:AAA family ATPase [Vibrio gallaecicus]|uniref:AAA family ATPase n=1 Tax=Vibrio gallaecicus TaxID=552386 RepID=UPI00142E9114|nr:AAA family ATPase [Vibrio gallaecicus]MDN3616764.1 AAA family ATPase [Vibrio gallaecicus]
MSASNFTFLNDTYSRLSGLAYQAESYIFSDPQTSAFKLRAYTELMVEYIYSHLGLESDDNADLFNRLSNQCFRDVVVSEIQAKLHLLRKEGNKAVHNNAIFKPSDAMFLTKEAYLVGRWFIQTMQHGYLFIPDFVPPSPTEDLYRTLEQKNEQLKADLANRAQEVEQTNHALDSVKKELRQAQEKVSLSEEELIHKARSFKSSSREAANNFDLQMEATRKKVSIMDHFEGTELTKGQRTAIDGIEEFVKSEDIDNFILHGYAGTGKTFITKGIVDYLTALGRKCVLLAPTGKAAKVISEKTGYAASTIHRAIYKIAETMDVEDGSDRAPVAPLKVNNDGNNTVYIVDEASMLSDAFSSMDNIQFGSGKVLSDLIEYSRAATLEIMATVNRKMIFVGDHAQLPPVGMSFSPALHKEYLQQKYQLKTVESCLDEVVRQKAGSGVMDNAIMLRDSIDTMTFNELDFSCAKGDINSVEHNAVIDHFMTVCNGQIKGTKNAMLIASSNKKVKQYNDKCREKFFPNQNKLCVGDKLISVANHYSEEYFVANGEFLLITKIFGSAEHQKLYSFTIEDGKKKNLMLDFTFRDVELLFKGEGTSVKRVKTKVIEHLLYNDEPGLTSEEMRALHIQFDSKYKDKSKEDKTTLRKTDPYLNAFKVKFGYAITCHKAQGSEWENVFVDCSYHTPSLLNKNYFQWLYTAITRTSSNLFVIDEPKIKLGSSAKLVGSTSWADGPEFNTPTVNPTSPSSSPVDIGEHELSSCPVELQDLYRKVQSLIAGHDIAIEQILHNNYQEMYVFKSHDATADVRLIYNGKFKVSNVYVLGSGMLQVALTTLLTPLKGCVLSSVTEGNAAHDFSFEKPHLETFHERLTSVYLEHGITVLDIKQNSWCQRYTLSKNNETAVIDFYYNGKHQFNRVAPMPNASSSKALLKECADIWTS